MGLLGTCCTCLAVLVALFAVLVGTLFSGHLRKTGIFSQLDRMEYSSGPFFKGMFPATHDAEPWGFTADAMPDLTGETHLVTGGNVGLGYWSAHHLAKAKATVILACRSEKKCQDAAQKIKTETGTDVHPTILDLSSFKSVRTCAASIAEKYPALDGLLLNAGIMVPPFQLTEDGIESQIGTNHFGHFLLTKLLLPQLEAGAAGKGVATIVAVSSAAHYDSYPEGILPTIVRMNDEPSYDPGAAYGQSKLANILFAQELADRVKDKNILVNSAHPGGVDTELGRHIEAKVRTFCEPCADWLFGVLAGAVWKPSDAALTQLYALVGPALRTDRVTGKYFHPIARPTKPDVHTFDKKLQKHLWDLTEEFIASH